MSHASSIDNHFHPYFECTSFLIYQSETESIAKAKAAFCMTYIVKGGKLVVDVEANGPSPYGKVRLIVRHLRFFWNRIIIDAKLLRSFLRRVAIWIFRFLSQRYD